MTRGNSSDRIRRELRVRIESAVAGHDRLPSMRAMARQFGASPVTVQRIISEFARAGSVEPIPGRGTFIRKRSPNPPLDTGWQEIALAGRPPVSNDLQALRAGREGLVDLVSGYPDQRLAAIGATAAAVTRVVRRPDSWRRTDPQGLLSLRQWFADESGTGARAADAAIAPGGQAALATIFRALAAPGSVVLVESPTYVGALAAIAAAGLRAAPVPTDADGMRVDLLPAAFETTRASVVYCQPTFANPTGASLGHERRQPLLEAARQAGAFVIEDDWARDLVLEGTAPLPLVRDDRDGRVVYVRSLTKGSVAGLRVAGIIARGLMSARLRAHLAVGELFVAPLLQEAALDLVTSAAWPRHLRTIRARLRERRDAAAEAVLGSWGDTRLRVPKGGLYLWIELPPGVDDVLLAREAEIAGIAISPGRVWFPAETPGRFVRLSYAATEADALAEAIAMLGSLRVTMTAP